MVKSTGATDDQRTISSFFRPSPAAATGSASSTSSRAKRTSAIAATSRSTSTSEPDLIILDSSDDEFASKTPPAPPLKRIKIDDEGRSSSPFFASSLPASTSSTAKHPTASTSSSRFVAPSLKVSKWQYKSPVDAAADQHTSAPAATTDQPLLDDDASRRDLLQALAPTSNGQGKGKDKATTTTSAPPSKLLAVNLLKKKQAYLQDQDPMAAINGDGDDSRATPRRANTASASPDLDGDEDEEDVQMRKNKKGKEKAVQSDEDEDEEAEGSSSRFQKFANKRSSKSTTKTDGIKYTPLEQQVIALRKANPGVLLVVEVGYKFRFFEEDAVTASRILGIAHFPSKNMMTASIPTHRLDVHIKRLINAGQKVGVVRQKETAALKKASAETRQGPFVRALDGLYTSATYIDPLSVEPLDSSSGNAATILCLVEELRGRDERVTIGMVAVKPSTGEVVYDEFIDGLMRSELETRILHLQPSEVVLQAKLSKQTESMVNYLVGQHDSGSSGSKCRLDRITKRLDVAEARKYMTEFYVRTKATRSRKGKEKEVNEIVIDSESDAEEGVEDDLAGQIGITNKVLDLPDLVLVALAALVSHLSAFDLSTVFFHESSFEHFSSRSTMNLNGKTLQNLELLQNNTDDSLNGSLLSVLDHCKSAFGRRRLRSWICHPLVSEVRVQERLEAVTEIVNSPSNLSLFKLRDLFKGLLDLERGLVRIHFGRATPQELLRVLQAFSRVANVFEEIDEEDERAGAPTPQMTIKSALLKQIVASLPKIKGDVDAYLLRIDSTKARDGKKAELFHNAPEELQSVRDCLGAVDREMAELLEDARKVLNKPKIEFRQVAEEEFLLELRVNEAKNLVPADWIKINSTKQVYRFRSPAIQNKMNEVNQNRERLDAAANAAFRAFLHEITATSYDALRAVISNLATADCLFSFAITAVAPGYVRPTIVREPGLIKIVEGRHPVHEVTSSQPYVPSSIELGGTGSQQMVLTGINAGGKSSFSRSVALIALMAQIGCYVPAESCTTSLFDGVYTRMGAADEIARGRSTFMVELSETSEILKLATDRSLVILDELGRGTSTNDGQAIASAVLQHIATTSHARTIFITHYPSLAGLAKRYPESISVHHMRCLEKERSDGFTDVTFLYKVGPGLASRSHGLNVARLAELPESVLSKALEKSKGLERITEERMRDRRANRMAAILRMLASDALTNEQKRELVEACANALL